MAAMAGTRAAARAGRQAAATAVATARGHRDDDQRPGQSERVDDVPGADLQPRRVDKPAAQPERGAGQRAGRARGGTAGDHDEPQVAVGGADRGQHAQGA